MATTYHYAISVLLVLLIFVLLFALLRDLRVALSDALDGFLSFCAFTETELEST